jgi:hypothetical protein
MQFWIPLVQIGSLQQSKKESLTELYVLTCWKILQHSAGYEPMETQWLYHLLEDLGIQNSVHVAYSVLDDSQLNNIRVFFFVMDSWSIFWEVGNGFLIIVQWDLRLQCLKCTEN